MGILRKHKGTHIRHGKRQKKNYTSKASAKTMLHEKVRNCGKSEFAIKQRKRIGLLYIYRGKNYVITFILLSYLSLYNS